MGTVSSRSAIMLSVCVVAAVVICTMPVEAGVTTRVSVASDGTQGDGFSQNAAISGDGRYVAFRSGATDLVAGDTNDCDDIFVHDRVTGATTRVSVASDGTEANARSQCPSISGDGRYVAFDSGASLVSPDTNYRHDVFVHDRVTGQTTRVSYGWDGEANESSTSPAITPDGRYVAFDSHASNLIGEDNDNNGAADVFVYDRVTHATTRVSVTTGGGEISSTAGCWRPCISADGRYVTFESTGPNVVPGDTNASGDVFVHDRVTHDTTRVNVASDGTQANNSSGSKRMAISGDGRYVVFDSCASNLVPGDTNRWYDTFVHDRVTGQTTRVSVASDGTEGDTVPYDCSGLSGVISADGRYVAFVSVATNLVPGDTNGRYDVFVHDRVTGQTRRVSMAHDGTEADLGCESPAISADGRYVAFQYVGSDLVPGDTNGTYDVFVHDRLGGGVPNTPTDLTSWRGAERQVHLSWTDNANNEDGFTVQRRKYDSATGWPATWTTVAQWLGMNVTVWTDTSITEDGQYQYRVRAFNAIGPGSWARPTRIIVCSTRPPTPTDFAAQLVDDNIARLTWTDNSDINKGFTLQRRQWDTATGWPAHWTTRRWLGANVETYDDTLTEDGIYQYRVRAFNSIGPSNWTRPRYLTRATARPTAPNDLALTAVDSTIRADWTANANNARGYVLQKRKRNPDGTWPAFATVKWLGPTVQSFTDTNLSGDGMYQYRVRAYNAVGPSAWAPYARIAYAGGVGMPGAISSVAVTQANGEFVNIVYGLSADADITIEVRNIAGRLVRAIPCGTAAAGLNTATWNLRSASGAPVPSGVYLCTITARADDGTQATAVRTVSVRR